MKAYFHVGTCTQMFIAVLLVIAQNWKLTKCLFVGEWLSKRWYIHIMDYNWEIKRNKPSIHVTAWMDLTGIMLSEKSQPRKETTA
uniref:Uncharacterized protein n=1 Tax=Ixodes ricinus TaxID=34613 RepID=A0A0K8R672_IXORI